MKFKHLCLTLFISFLLLPDSSKGQTNNYRFSRKIELQSMEFIANAMGVESEEGAIMIYQINDALDGHYLLLVEFDSLGKKLNSKKWSNPLGELQISGLSRIGNEKYHLNGLLNDGVGNKVFAIEFDDNLNVSKTYASGRSLSSFLGGDMYATSDTVYGIIHSDLGPVYYVYDRVLDSLIGSFCFMTNTDPVFKKITKAKNGDVYLAGNSSTEDLIIVAMADDLNLAWANTYEFSGDNVQISAMQALGDSLLLLTGYADRLGDQANSGFLMELNLLTFEVKVKIFDVQHDLKILDIEVVDSTFLLCGEAEYYGNGIQNGFLLELNRNLDLMRARVLDASFSSTIHALNSGKGDKTFFIAKRNENEPEDSGFMALINNELFCEMQDGNLDVREDTVFSNPRTYQGGSDFLPWLPIQIIEDTISTNIQNTCDLGTCFQPLDILLDNAKICIGDTLRFYVNDSYDAYSWSLNGIDIGTDNQLIFIYNGEDLEVELDAKGSETCFFYGNYSYAPISHQDVLEGPNSHCPFNEALWYKSKEFDGLFRKISLTNGELINSTNDSIQILWKGKGSIDIIYEDSTACQLSKRSIQFEPDSGKTQAPEILMASYDRTSKLDFLELELPDYNSALEDKFELFEIDDQEERKITDLIEGENKWISPQETDLAVAYKIRVKNECNIELSSDTHRRVNLEFDEGKLLWTNYLGWENQNTAYELFRSNEKVETSGKYEFQPLSFEELNDCYIVIARNEDLLSYSNEICLERELDISFTNFVSQNADGRNDTWIVDDISIYPNHQIKIFNRWGKKVFESKDYKNDWPQEKLIAGDYFFHFELNGIHYKGWIKLVD